MQTDYPWAPGAGTLPHPGESIAEWLIENQRSQIWLAQRLDVSAKHLNQIIRGRALYSAQFAIKMGRVTKIPAQFWWAMRCNYELNQAQVKKRPR